MERAWDASLRVRLSLRLARFDRHSQPLAALRPAAVGLVVVPDARGEASLLLTLRAQGMSRHSGQFALPGGRVDAGETPEETARRELLEELGLDLGPESVLGLLDDYPTRSGYRITPVVLWGSEAEPRPAPREVAEVFHVPLADLADPATRREHGSGEGGATLLALRLAGTLVFPPTAALLHQFAEVALHGRDTRVAHLAQPSFAWR